MSHDPGQPRPHADRSSLPRVGLQELEARLLLSASPLDEQNLLEPTSASQPEVTAASGTQTLGIDVSHWQGAINWASVEASGIEFVWAKATEGVNFVDSRWVSNVNGANNAGVFAGGYHFATPYTGGVNDAAAEASDFYDALSPYLGDGFLRPALDLERGSELSTTVLSNWVHDFMNEFISLSGGIVPIIYMNTSYATSEVNSSVNIYDLWLANPTNNLNNPPTNDGVWNGYDLWQYSWTTSVPGIAGDVDGNVFFGDLSGFTAKYVINTVPDDHGDDSASATAISAPSTTAGVIGTASDSDWFELTLNSGDDYTFSLLDDGMASGELRLYTNTSTLLLTDTGPASGGTLAELTFTPIVTGTYYLSVDSSGTGGYDLAVQETDDHGDTIGTATTLIGGVALGGIQTSTDTDYFNFTATAGMQYDIQVLDAGLPDAALTLYTPGGAVVDQDAGSNPGGTHAQILWTASSSGQMYVAASANPGSLGDYFITLTESDPQIDGDLDGDGFVGISDLNVVLGNWNLNVTAGDLLSGDPSGDGFVGIADLNVVLGNWNAGTPPAASGQQDEVLAETSGTQILGIDVSVWQGQVNWNSVAGSGREFAFIRALDRNGAVDTRFFSNIVNSQAAGIWAGAYQFVTPWTDGYNDAVDEATQFANLIAPYLTEDYLRPVIDIEAGPPHSPTPMELDNTVLTDWVHDYMTTFVSLTGIEPLIYTNTDHAVNAFDTGVNVYDLWLANWTGDPNSPPGGNADGVWNGYDLWQYSGGGESIPGIVGGVDGNVFFGDVNQLVTDYGINLPVDDHGNDRFTATSVAVPSATAGTLDSVLLDPDWFELALDAGEDYTFNVVGGTLASAEISLYTSTGTLISTDNTPAAGGVLAELQFTTIVADTYYVAVKSTGDAGSYLLAVQETDDHGDTIGTATTLIGGVALGGIQTSTDTDYFNFTATAGMQYDIQVLDAGLPDAALTLYTPGGAVVDQDAGSNPGGTHAQILWTASSSGQMYVAASANPGSLGDYFITLTESDPQLDGDLDGDGFVGIADLNVVLGNWNLNVTAGDLLSGDPSGDGFVGIADLNVVLGNWNAGTPPSATSGSQDESAAQSVSQPTEADTGSQSVVVDHDMRGDTSVERDTLRREAPAAPLRAERAQGLAIANWRTSERSVFGDDGEERYTPAMGLWEPDDEA